MIAKFAKILRVTGVKTGVGVLIFDVNRSRIGVGFCNFGAGLESESQKSDSGHLCNEAKALEFSFSEAMWQYVIGLCEFLKQYVHGRPQGGARGGTCPPLKNQKS